MEGRDPQQKVAATRTEIGTDVNYGEITRQLIASLQKKSNFSLQLSSEVRALKRNDDNTWTVTVADLKNGTAQNIRAKFVFIGAGGAALKLLQESGIPEAKDYAGFPVGGQFLVSENPDVVNHHLAKVYGKASVGAPPMSVPHIDTRVLDGKRVVLFGPFATFSTKFLKNGSLWDLMSSTTTSNVMPMMHVGLDNFDLVKLIGGPKASILSCAEPLSSALLSLLLLGITFTLPDWLGTLLILSSVILISMSPAAPYLYRQC